MVDNVAKPSILGSIAHKIVLAFSQWLLKDEPPKRAYLCDFPQICAKVTPGNVLLIEGRSRASNIIKLISQSPWSHAALYIGEIDKIKSPELKELAKKWNFDTKMQLIVESELGSGTIISPLKKYENDHIRILRPQGITDEDAENVILFAVKKLGAVYNIRHVFDLARFMFPWSIFPRKWRSSLFSHNALKPTEDICSSMIAEAFESIHFPILPVLSEDGNKHMELTERNIQLFTPSDFDFSPYFSIIKYPIFPVDQKAYYRSLPWKQKMIEEENIIFTKNS